MSDYFDILPLSSNTILICFYFDRNKGHHVSTQTRIQQIRCIFDDIKLKDFFFQFFHKVVHNPYILRKTAEEIRCVFDDN